MSAGMHRGVRRAGVARLADGAELVWSVADGRRGRRWRAVTKRDGAVAASILLEVDPDGRPARFELSTGTGLLTLHPEPTGLLHGNAVTGAGVRHLTMAWSEDHDLEFEPLAIGSAVTAHRIGGSLPTGEGRTVPIIAIGLDLEVRETSRRYERLDTATWRIEGDGDARTLEVDERGLPRWPVEVGEPVVAGEWALELDPQP
jgi:hypothetical protein